jgi:hypothetical protein
LLANRGFDVPVEWRATRIDQGEWQFELFDYSASEELVDSDHRVSVVKAKRYEDCNPDDLSNPSHNSDWRLPIDPAFPAGFVADVREDGSSSHGKGPRIRDSACVHGDQGALIVTVYGYDERYRPRIRALLLTLGETTDGAHQCAIH